MDPGFFERTPADGFADLLLAFAPARRNQPYPLIIVVPMQNVDPCFEGVHGTGNSRVAIRSVDPVYGTSRAGSFAGAYSSGHGHASGMLLRRGRIGVDGRVPIGLAGLNSNDAHRSGSFGTITQAGNPAGRLIGIEIPFPNFPVVSLKGPNDIDAKIYGVF